MNHHLKSNCENVDASIFSGDVLYDDAGRAELKEYVARWARAVAEHEEQERAEPVAPAVQERERFEAEFPIPEGMVYWDGDKYGVLPDYENSYRADRYCGQWRAWQARSALATLPPASAAGEREDLSQWEKARFGYFDQAGRFVEFSGEDNELPNDSSPRWVGGLHDMQLLRAALATKPQAEQKATPPAQTVQDTIATEHEILMSFFNLMQNIFYPITPHQHEIKKRMLATGAALRAARTRGDEVGKSS